MTEMSQRFFLFIGSADSDAAASKLKTSGTPYRRKMLESRPENWHSIREIIEDPSLIGVVGKLTGHVYDLITRPGYEQPAHDVFRALGKVPHVIFVHESVLSGEDPSIDENPGEDDEYEHMSTYESFQHHYFTTPSGQVREIVGGLLDQYGVNVVPYRSNAEMSVLAAAFIDDNERNLLFRVYVPSGRLYAAEADRVLSLFQDWLSQVGRHAVRQDGYRTAAGQVYEFYGSASLAQRGISREFDEFSNFLTLCSEEPEAATERLSREGLDRRTSASLVSRYGREVRRLHVDLRHERESRMLAIRHSLESELLDMSDDHQSPGGNLAGLLEALIPQVGDSAAISSLLAGRQISAGSPVIVNINPQFVHAVESSVVQNIQGTVHLGAEAHEILDLVRCFGGNDSDGLESAVHELEDPDARPVDRLGAKQRLKGFLLRLGGTVEAAALAALQKYIEAKMGV